MTSLADKVARVKELDAKRIRGELTHEDNVATLDNLVLATEIIAQLWDEREYIVENYVSRLAYNSFVEKVQEQDAIIQKQREVLGMAREALIYVEANYDGMNKADVPMKALTAIDNVMNQTTIAER